MKNIYKYIFEKLKISKDSKISTLDEKLRNINEYDTCLLLTFVNNYGNIEGHSWVSIDAVTIIKKNEMSFKCKYITHICSKNFANQFTFTVDPRQNDDWKFLLYSKSETSTCILIHKKDCDKILDKIQKDYKLSLDNVLINNFDNIDKSLEHIVAEKSIAAKDNPISWRNLTRITDYTLHKLIKVLK